MSLISRMKPYGGAGNGSCPQRTLNADISDSFISSTLSALPATNVSTMDAVKVPVLHEVDICNDLCHPITKGEKASRELRFGNLESRVLFYNSVGDHTNQIHIAFRYENILLIAKLLYPIPFIIIPYTIYNLVFE